MDNKSLFRKHKVSNGISSSELKVVRRKIRKKLARKLRKALK